MSSVRKHRVAIALAGAATISVASVSSRGTAGGPADSPIHQATATENEPGPQDYVLTEADIAVVTKARAVFALDTSRRSVEPLMNDIESWQRGLGIGFPVTEEEALVLAGRFEIQNATARVIEESERILGTSFAGGWLEFNEGKIHVAAVADSPDPTAGALGEMLSVPEQWIELHVVDQSDDELQALAQRVESDLQQGNDELVDAGVVAVGVDLVTNSVLVLLEDLQTTAGTAEQLASAYGAHPNNFVFELFEPTPNDSVESALFGGHQLGSDDAQCSVGPWGWVLFVGFYLSTASHCPSSSYDHRSPVGPGYAPSSDLLHGPTYDLVAETSLSGTVSSDAAVYARRGGSSEHTRLVEGWAGLHPSDLVLTGTANPAPGTIVCHAGSKSRGVGNCGPMTSPASWPCPGFSQMRGVSYGSGSGDSGAVVYQFIWGNLNVPLVGLHRGIACNGYKYFTYHENARAALGLSGWHVS